MLLLDHSMRITDFVHFTDSEELFGLFPTDKKHEILLVFPTDKRA